MDHLQTLPNSTFTLPSIYYHGTIYKTIQAEDFCASLKAEAERLYNNHDEESIARIQTLLYFGLLNQALGTIVYEQYIKRDADGRSILTTKHLEHDTKNRFKTLKKIRNAAKKEALKGIHNCIEQVRNIVEEPPNCDKICTILDKDFVLAVQVLGASLAYAVIRFAEDNGMTNNAYSSQWLVPWAPKNAWASAKMLENGWCPYEVERFSQMLCPLTQISALGLQSSASNLDHSICTKFVCEANNVKGPYVPTHTQECVESSQSCNFENSNIEEVAKILREGGLPLIEIRRKSSGSLELRAIKYRPGKRFVTISHVWSDGMGNKEKNEMRTCQLTRIWEKARLLIRDNSQITLSSDSRVNLFVLGFAYLSHSTRNLLDIDQSAVTIWMDTLCIPLEPYDMRGLAIKGMRGAYEKAYKVLILDSELSYFDHTDNLEPLLRIQHRSGWIRRLWTLNEGIYSQQRLFACFKNCIVRVPGMADRLLVEDDRGKFPLFTKPVAYDAYANWLLKSSLIADALPSRRLERAFFFEKAATLCLRIAVIWENVVERMTTTESDRPILSMSLLGLDLSPVLNIPPRIEGSPERGAIERMRAVYKALPEFSQSMIFQNGKRFEEYGMRWATTHWSNAAGKGLAQGRLRSIPGRILDKGLCVEYPALLVSGIDDGWELGLWTKYQHKNYVSALAAFGLYRCSELPVENLDGETQIGLLMENDRLLEAVINGPVTATAVSILKEGDGIRYCKFLGRLQVSKIPSIEAVLGFCNEAEYFHKGEVVWCVG